MKLDLLNQSYPDKSIDNNQSELINMYLSPDKSRGKEQLIAYSMPGLSSFSNTTQANVRALLEHNEVLYAVAGNTFYSIDSSGTTTSIGTLNTSSGFAKMVVITGGNDTNNQIIIIDGTNGYHYNITTVVATFPIADVDFPQTCTDITVQDDYVMVQNLSSIKFNLSNSADGTSWAALDFASKVGFADRLVATASCQRKLYLIGSKTTEVWYNSGNSSFPFERVPDVFIQHGCAAKRSVVVSGEYLMFLAKTGSGGYEVVKINGYVPQPIGNPAIDYQINQMTTKSDAVAYCFMIDGHEFYELTFPTDAKTFTYDITTGAWLTRKSNAASVFTRFLGNCSAFCYDKSLIGDYNSGVIFKQLSTVYQENGNTLQRRFVSPPVYFEGKRIFISRLQVDVEVNVGTATFDLDYSNDGGRTWTTYDTYTVPTTPATQLYTTSLGSDFNWMFRITSTSNANITILGFSAELGIGAN